MAKNQPSTASIKDIATAAGVSTATVSRVFNRSDQVRPALVGAVLKAASDAGYHPRQATRKDTIVLLVEDLDALVAHTGSYDAMIIASLITAAARRNLRTEVLPPAEIPLIRTKFIAGVISTLHEPESIAKLAEIGGTSIAAINTDVANAQCFCSDEKQGIELAIDHLVAHGHQRIELFTDSSHTWSRDQRVMHLRAALEERGLEFSPDSVHIAVDPSEVLYKLIRALKRGATAFIAPGEGLGVCLAHYLVALEKSVPKDLSVVGYEFPGVSEHLYPPQTTLVQDFAQLAESAIRTILEEPAEHSLSLVPYKLIERESVGPAAG